MTYLPKGSYLLCIDVLMISPIHCHSFRNASAFLCRSMALAKFLKETYGKQSVLDAIKGGGWKAFLDGTLA